MLWKMGFSVAKIAPSPPYTPPGTIKTRKGFGSTIRNSRLASSHRPRLFRSRTRLWRRAGTARHISGLRPPNCLGLVGLWPPSRRRGVPGLRTPFGRVLAPPPLRGFDGYGLFPPQAAAFARPSRALPWFFFTSWWPATGRFCVCPFLRHLVHRIFTFFTIARKRESVYNMQ